MAAPASKRRKLEHLASEDEDEDSFASFSDSNDGKAVDGDAVKFPGYDGNRVEEEEEADDGLEETYDDVGGDELDQDGSEASDEESFSDEIHTTSEANQRSKGKPHSGLEMDQRQPSAHSPQERGHATYTSGTFKSNTFKLQVDDLLEQIRPRHGTRETAAEDMLHRLKKSIEAIPAQGPLSIEQAERQLLKSNKIAIPFPHPRPPKDAKYKLEFARPSNINVAGSYTLKTRSRSGGLLEIDMIVTMPSSMFQGKDYLNYRYFYKRAFYLARIAAGVKEAYVEECTMYFRHFHENPLKPILVVSPQGKADESGAKSSTRKWQINIIPCISTDVFSSEKLLPDRNCVRSPTEPASNGNRTDHERDRTAFYNSSLRSDMVMTSYMKLLHSASRSCSAFQDACLLGSTWLRQRGFNSNIHAGGFGNFEWSALVALMLQSGGPRGRPILSEGYSSYQIFKATLQLVATKEFNEQPMLFGPADDSITCTGDGSPLVWDTERRHNLLFKMPAWSYKILRNEARTTLNMLNDQNFEAFESTFTVRADTVLYHYDYVVRSDSSLIGSAKSQSHSNPLPPYRKLYEVLQRGFGDRVKMIDIKPQWSDSWDTGFAGPTQNVNRELLICFAVNPDTINRTVDHGPSPEDKTEAISFRQFWGDKAELRRFKDGSIRESLVWSSKHDGQSLFEQILRCVVTKHFGAEAEQKMTVYGDGFSQMLPHMGGIAAFQPCMEAYKQLESDIRGLRELPLSIRDIKPADAKLRYASTTLPAGSNRSRTSDVVIQFEGSSRWPDDLVAIQRTKIAFLLKLSEYLQESGTSLTAQVGLENGENDILNQGYLEVMYESGAAFRLRIHHDREQTLLERRLKDKTLDPMSKESAAVGLASYKRDYVKAPAHTQAIASLCSRHPAMSGTIRLVKKWFASHLLSRHIAEEVIEMLVARAFVQPWPWPVPSTVQTGFLRTLFFTSRWDWRAEPLIVDLSGTGYLKQSDVQTISTKFEAWRKLDPALNRVVLFAASSMDHDGTTWTDGHPAKVVAGRMSALARAACAKVEEKQLKLEPAALFSSPLQDFDFVIHLDAKLSGRTKKKNRGAKNGVPFKNLELDTLNEDSLIGYDPVQSFVHEVESTYSTAILFFSGGHEKPVIAALWTPQTASRPWKLNLAYSTTPQKRPSSEETLAEVNKDAILAEISRLGGDMIEKIQINRN